MKQTITFILILVFLFGCSTKKEIAERESEQRLDEATIHFFKVQAFCACYKHAFKENDIIKLMAKEDLMGSFDRLQNEDIMLVIDSLGKSEADKIQPEEYVDYIGTRRITDRCLEFYTSKKLDSIARATIKFSESGELEYQY